MIFIPNFIFRTPAFSYSNSMNEDLFKESLYLSSPAFFDEYDKSISKTIVDSKDQKKISISLYKYRSRASYRCTPFGLFAGLSIGEWKNENRITFSSDIKSTLVRRTRLDMNVLYSLTQELTKQSFIKPYLKFYPNSSIYLLGNSYRYIEYYYYSNVRFHKINRVDFTTYLEYILNESKVGLTLQQITNLLTDENVNEQEALEFVNELISAQLLINQFEPTVTGIDYFHTLLNNLNELYIVNESDELQKLLILLNSIENLIKENDLNILNSIESYKNIYLKLKLILPELSETNLFQTDLYKKTIEGNLSNKISQQLKDTIAFVNKIYPVNPNPKLEDFKKRFQENYEGCEIPLQLALDNETGIGYPSKDRNGINDLIDGVHYFGKGNQSNDIKWNLLQSHLLKIISKASKYNKKSIEINEEDFKGIDFSEGTLPSSISVMFKVLDPLTDKIYMSDFGGSSAINILGRFAGGNKELQEIVNSIAKFEQEQSPEKILAEIVHLPESRTGNVLARPSFREYEIPYLAKSTLDYDYQIKMEDLILKIQDNKIILFDKRLNKEVIPRLSNAHNFRHNSLPVYHFLSDMQTQYFSKPYVGFSWGVLENEFDFLPRLEYKNTVLKAARWHLRLVDLTPLKDKKKTDLEKHTAFFELKNRIGLPDVFLIADGDNELLIDCSNSIAIETFIDSIKTRNDIRLEEFLFDVKNALVKDTDGNSFTNECIAIILNESSSKAQKINTKPIEYKTKKIFSIGSEWLYLKIYCGVKTADFILTDKIKRVCELLINEHIIDKWFFIRYADPEPHLRLRLNISNLNKYSEVLQLINLELEPLIEQHIIPKMQIDTYSRELERYGENSIVFVEQLFYNDSVFVIKMLDLLDSESGGTIRWQIAIRSVDELLNDFKLSLNDKYTIIENLSKLFFKEHGGRKELKLTLDDKFRKLRAKVESVLNVNLDNEKDFFSIIELLNDRSKMNAEVITEILTLQSNNKLQLPLFDLIASLLHMNLDRLFMGQNRTNEFVVYDLLFRHYKSSLARINTKIKTNTGNTVKI